MNIRFLLKNYRHWIRRAVFRTGGGRVEMGRFSYGSPLVRWWGEPANLSIGQFCSIADDVQIFLGGNHRTDWITTYPFPVLREWNRDGRFSGHPKTMGDVTIGNDVWLGSGCVILSGVTIGNGAVVGCRSVVSRDVPAYTIAAGNPAKNVRKRFTDEDISRLQESAWWDWPVAQIQASMPFLLSGDVAGFLEKKATPGGVA